MLGVKTTPLRSVLLPWLLLRVMFPHYTKQCSDYRSVFLFAPSLNLHFNTIKGTVCIIHCTCSLCLIGLLLVFVSLIAIIVTLTVMFLPCTNNLLEKESTTWIGLDQINPCIPMTSPFQVHVLSMAFSWQ